MENDTQSKRASNNVRLNFDILWLIITIVALIVICLIFL